MPLRFILWHSHPNLQEKNLAAAINLGDRGELTSAIAIIIYLRKAHCLDNEIIIIK